MLRRGLLAGSLFLVAPPVSASIRVTGGTPEQQREVQAVLSKLPECMSGTLSENGVEVQITKDDQDASYWRRDDEEKQPPLVKLDLEFWKNPENRVKALNPSCVARKDFQDMPVPEILLHEVAHAWNDHNQERVNDFLRRGYARKYRNYQNDPRVQKLVNELRRQFIENPDVTERELCPTVYELWKLQVRHGLVNRNPGDIHSLGLEEDQEEVLVFADFEHASHEYFAMLVQAYSSNGWKFCSATNADEQAWFAENMSDCLRQYGTPACLRENARSHRLPSGGAMGAGMRR